MDPVELTPALTPNVEAVEWMPPGKWSRHTPIENVRLYLAVLAVTGNNTLSCAKSGVSRDVVKVLRREDPTFDAAREDALEEASDLLEQEARRRAVMGVDRPVYQGGEMVGSVREYSDRLLETMLRARVPAYADKAAQVDARSVNIVMEGAAPPQGDDLLKWIDGLKTAAASLRAGGSDGSADVG